MLSRSKQARGTTLPLYALGAIFFVPLAIGVLLVNNSANRNDHANQVSRDVASMYAQGLDFSTPSNQDIALKVAEGLGMDIRGGKGVLILSRIRVVHSADCAAGGGGHCTNEGFAVITQRYVIGNRALRSSSFGTPTHVDPGTGNVRDWANDVTARAEDFPANLKAGESTYAAECYLASQEPNGGVYSRAMF
jgi:hypothetical protein